MKIVVEIDPINVPDGSVWGQETADAVGRDILSHYDGLNHLLSEWAISGVVTIEDEASGSFCRITSDGYKWVDET